MYVRPHLGYWLGLGSLTLDSPAWAALTATETGLLESLQSIAMRVIIMLLTMMAIFVIAWGPFLCQAFYVAVFKKNTRFNYAQHTPRLIFTAMSFSSAALNSIILPINSNYFHIKVIESYGSPDRAQFAYQVFMT
ncbi:hypothetical protein CAPTEDRAFT_217754, partial [Capitella teleta]